MFQIIKEFKKDDFFGTSPPSIFVGHNFYPNLNVGILSPPAETEDAWIHDAPNFWSEQELLNKTKELIKTKFNYDVDEIYKQSKLLRNLTQLKLISFFN